MWNPEQYRRYRTERSRAFFDLLLQVDAPEARTIADLGCGPGELTATLAERWPSARIWGMDSSPEMIAAAAQYALPNRLSFELGNLADWQPSAPLDVLVSNAALQWVYGHEILIPRLASCVAPQGWLAFQVPGGFEALEVLDNLRASPAWRDKVGVRPAESQALPSSAAWYLNVLAKLNFEVNAWETTYLHVLQGEDAALEWVKGTVLRPVLTKLTAEEQTTFLHEYREKLRVAYPRLSFGTIFPFRRLFVVARRK